MFQQYIKLLGSRTVAYLNVDLAVVGKSSRCLLVHLVDLGLLIQRTNSGNESHYQAACAVLLNVVLIVCVPFPFGVWGS